jgi:hypothetical protein
MDAVYTEDHILPSKYEALVLLEYPSIDLETLKEKFRVFGDFHLSRVSARVSARGFRAGVHPAPTIALST